MLEPFRQVSQWALQKARSLPLAMGQPNPEAVPAQPLPPETPQDTFEAAQPKQAGFTPAQGKVLWQAGKERANLLKNELFQTPFAQKISARLPRKKPPQAKPSPYRSRQMVMKDFPPVYRSLDTIPRFTLTPEEIAINPQVQKQIQNIEAEILDQHWNSDNLFMPFGD